MAIKARLLDVYVEKRQIKVKFYSDDVPEQVVDQRGLDTTLRLTVPTDVDTLLELKALIFANAPRELLGEYENLQKLRQYIGQEVVE